jgi:hypothetical protein
LLYYNQVLNYTTLDKTRTIQFGLTNSAPGAEGWRAYILSPIYYMGRADDCHSTHRYYDDLHDMYYVCWDPEPDTFDEMKSIVAMWGELTHDYIRTGESIDSQFARRCRRRW